LALRWRTFLYSYSSDGTRLNEHKYSNSPSALKDGRFKSFFLFVTLAERLKCLETSIFMEV
jgi:hypothetical protein